jgi:hypothetical protein
MKEYKSLNGFEKDIKKNGVCDIVKINDVVYTLDYYDLSGELITYANKRTGLGISIFTSNRYGTNKFNDVEARYERNMLIRNDISYYD